MFASIFFTLVSCDSTESVDPSDGTSGGAVDQSSTAGVELVPVDDAVASASFAGIPFGNFAQPTEAFGSRFSGALRNEAPDRLLRELAGIKARHGRVALFLASSPKYYVDGAGNFDMGKWKGRVNRFKGINFASYINDGTVVGHMLIDEPNDASNWNGKPVSASTVEEMARYSKELWPNLPTLVRAAPSYLLTNHRYLDAAWAQYLSRHGDVKKYIAQSVSDAQKRGLGLVVGMNVLKGGNPNGTKMSASEVESYGSALLSSTYPCAFLNWKYESDYVSAVGNAMDRLRAKAQNRPNKSCRGS
jgi:hypothetical protein